MPMIGVVIWENESSGQAAIWCQDKASLAYLEGRENLTDQTFWPRSGDLVELKSETIGSTRYARDVTGLPPEKSPTIPKELRCPHNPDCISITFPVCQYSSPDCKRRCG